MIDRDRMADAAEARRVLGEAEDRASEAEAWEDVVSRPGLRYSPLDGSEMVYAVACDGTPIGRIWRGPEGALLGGWTCSRLDSDERRGPFRTARAAAAAL